MPHVYNIISVYLSAKATYTTCFCQIGFLSASMVTWYGFVSPCVIFIYTTMHPRCHSANIVQNLTLKKKLFPYLPYLF